MKSLSSDYWDKINQVSTNSAWYLLLELVASNSTTLYLTNNNEDVLLDFSGQTYSRFPFKVEPVTESMQGEIPRIRLSLSNADLYLNSWIQDNGGFVGNGVTLMVVNSALLNGSPAVSETFTILETVADNKNVALTLGISSPLNKRLPRDRYIANICRHPFNYPGRTDGRAARCGYTGSDYATCRHTLADCRLRNNSHRYGGSPGVAEGVN